VHNNYLELPLHSQNLFYKASHFPCACHEGIEIYSANNSLALDWGQ
jgi:hypothetical protein